MVTHVAEELEVDLVDDAGAGRHDAEAAQGGLGPAQQLVALAVALVLALDIEGVGVSAAEAVDLHAVVDDQAGRDQRVHQRRIAPQLVHRVAHGSEVDHGRDAGEVLQQHPTGHEGDLDLAARVRAPVREGGHVVRGGGAGSRAAQHVLEQDLDREGQLRETVADRIEAVDGGFAVADTKARTGVSSRRVGHRGHEASSSRARRARS